MEQLLFSGGSDMHTFFFQLQILDIHGLRSLGQSGQINFNGLQQMCGICFVMHLGQFCFEDTLYLVFVHIDNGNSSGYDFAGYQSLKVQSHIFLGQRIKINIFYQNIYILTIQFQISLGAFFCILDKSGCILLCEFQGNILFHFFSVQNTGDKTVSS